MPEVKKNIKKMSDHAKKKARRKAEPRNGYEYQMSQERYNAMYPEDKGKLNHINEVIQYLNREGGFLRQITKLSVM